MKNKNQNLFGVLADQAIVSAGNFALNILLARDFSENGYGAFALILSFILFLNSLHQAFVTYALSVKAAPAEASRNDYFLSLAAVLTLLEAALFLPIIGAASFSAHQPAMFFAAVLFMLAWQLQEVWRRGLIARAHTMGAVATDIIRYIAPLAPLALLGAMNRLSLPLVFLILIAASLAASWPLFAKLRAQLGPVRQTLRFELADHWRLAAPVLGANLLAAFSTQWFLWLLAWGHDLASSAALVALANIVGFSSPVMYGLENILVPEIARNRNRMAFSDLMSLVGRRALAGAILVAPFFLIVLVRPAPVLTLFYGAHKSYAQFTFALQLLACAYITYLIAYVMGATLRGYRASAAVLKMQLYPALMGITVGSLLTLRFGVTGACLAALLAGSLRAAIGCYHVSRLRALTVPQSHPISTHRAPKAAPGVARSA